MTPAEHEKLLMDAVQENVIAFQFLKSLGAIFRVWDDLYDQDRPVPREKADLVFTDFMFELSRNSFYREHREVLEAQIFIAWNAWADANLWEDDADPLKKQCAWFIRDYCNEIVFLCAWLIGGKEHARKITTPLRALYLKELQESD